MHIVPTLNFSGSYREAIKTYARAFDGEVACLITYRDADDPTYNSLLREDQRDYVCHAELMLRGQRIILCDHVDIQLTTCYTNFLTVMMDTKEEVRRAYAVMKDGSRTIYPMEATPYSSCQVVFVDRFGIRWGIMTEQTER